MPFSSIFTVYAKREMSWRWRWASFEINVNLVIKNEVEYSYWQMKSSGNITLEVTRLIFTLPSLPAIAFISSPYHSWIIMSFWNSPIFKFLYQNSNMTLKLPYETQLFTPIPLLKCPSSHPTCYFLKGSLLLWLKFIPSYSQSLYQFLSMKCSPNITWYLDFHLNCFQWSESLSIWVKHSEVRNVINIKTFWDSPETVVLSLAPVLESPR